jgi:magnesium chelatase family protein
MLSERLPAILPDLDERDAFEVTSLYSVAGLLPGDRGRITPLTYRSPPRFMS